MWVKYDCPGKELTFFKLDDMYEIKAKVDWIDTDEGAEQWAAIFFKTPYQEGCLARYNNLANASEALLNLFRKWSKWRDSLYLIPQGTDWVIEAVGRDFK